MELIISDYLRHVLLRHQGDLSSALLEKCNDSFQFYTKSTASSKYVGPEAATYARVKGETLNAWLAIYGAISSRLYVAKHWLTLYF